MASSEGYVSSSLDKSGGGRFYWVMLTISDTGNMYSIQNPYNRPARIFFSQGCVVGPDALQPPQQQDPQTSMIEGAGPSQEDQS